MGLAPPSPLGGVSLRFQLFKYPGGRALVSKSCASGFYGSGITLLNSGQGILSVNFTNLEVSGFDQGAYYFEVRRTDSGQATPVSRGYRLLF